MSWYFFQFTVFNTKNLKLSNINIQKTNNISHFVIQFLEFIDSNMEKLLKTEQNNNFSTYIISSTKKHSHQTYTGTEIHFNITKNKREG